MDYLLFLIGSSVFFTVFCIIIQMIIDALLLLILHKKIFGLIKCTDILYFLYFLCTEINVEIQNNKQLVFRKIRENCFKKICFSLKITFCHVREIDLKTPILRGVSFLKPT